MMKRKMVTRGRLQQQNTDDRSSEVYISLAFRSAFARIPDTIIPCQLRQLHHKQTCYSPLLPFPSPPLLCLSSSPIDDPEVLYTYTIWKKNIVKTYSRQKEREFQGDTPHFCLAECTCARFISPPALFVYIPTTPPSFSARPSQYHRQALNGKMG